MKTIILVITGFLFLGLGTIGLFLPLLPTTPFVLISAACFSTTPRLRNRIMRIKFFREYLENYQKRTGLSRKTVVISLLYLWGMLLISMLLAQRLWVTLLLITIGGAVTTHIIYMKSSKGEKREIEK